MFLLVPYEIETLQQERPVSNWLLIALISLVSVGAFFGAVSEEAVNSLLLYEWGPMGLFGHVFLHADFMHLIGNMVFLWVFGNAICMNISNKLYLPLFVVCALISAVFHNVFDGAPAIGASGAINGIVGLVLVMYPLNRVYVFWLFFIKGGTFAVKARTIILFWLVFDLWGAVSGGGGIAYWAHIGGLLGGIVAGLVCLQMNWIQVTHVDNRTLLEIIKGEYPDED